MDPLFYLSVLENLPQKLPDRIDLGRANRVRHRVRVPFDRIALARQGVARGLGAAQRNDVVVLAVSHEDRQVPVGRARLFLEGRSKRQIRREREHAGEALREAQRGLQHDRAALRKAGQDEFRRGDAARRFAGNHLLDRLLRCPDAGLVLGSAAELEDVVPRAHAHTVVDRHRADGGVREHEAHRLAQLELGHHRLEVVAVGAQAVQPDHRGGGVLSGFDLDRFHGRSVAARMPAKGGMAMLGRTGICLAVVLMTGAPGVSAQPSPPEEPAQEAERKPPEKLQIGALAGLARPAGFVVEDLRTAESRKPTPFRQTYKAPFSPFKQPVPLAKFERTLGDEEFSVSPLELLAEKLVEHYGEKLAGQRLVVHEFAYTLEQVVNKPQGMNYTVIPGGGVSFATALALSVIGSAAGTVMMAGKGIDLRLQVKIDAELDGRRIEAFERPMALGSEGPARVTRYAIEKFLLKLGEASAVEKPAASVEAQPPAEPAKAD